MLAGAKCIVFDIDDTLYLERDYVQSGFAAVGAWLEARQVASGFAALAWERFQQGQRGNVFDETLRAVGLATDSGTICEMISVYRSHNPSIALLADARYLLEELKEREVGIACISDGPYESQLAKSAALGLAQWCHPIVLTESLGPGHSKPHELAYQLVEETVRVQGSQCVYVADNPTKDFIAARKRGWRTVRVRRAGGLHFARPSGGDVDFEVADLWSVTR
jgi:putative hydrolase of the HAD superfamily